MGKTVRKTLVKEIFKKWSQRKKYTVISLIGGCYCCFSVAQTYPTFAIPWTAACQASLSFTVSTSLLRFRSIELVMPSHHLILCCSFLLMPSIFSSIRVFSKESALCIRWWKYWSFSFSLSLSNEYSGLISFRIEWLDLLEYEWAYLQNRNRLTDQENKSYKRECSDGSPY